MGCDWGRRRMGACFFLCSVLLIGAARGQPAAAGRPDPGLPAVDCVLVDTDSNLDDLRALAVIAPFLPVRAVVATDGILSAGDGADITNLFLSNLPGRAPIPVMAGSGRTATSPPPPAWVWLADARTDARRLKPLLLQISPSTVKSNASALPRLSERIAGAFHHCTAIGLLMIGPWSSFLNYHQEIIGRLKYVIVQGRSPFDPTPQDNPDWDRVNCRFDRDACLFSLGLIEKTPVYWVDLPDKGPAYPINEAFISALKGTPLGLSLKRLMSADPAWRKQQQWDELAAMFILRPEKFKAEGQHYLPDQAPAAMRALEAALINGER